MTKIILTSIFGLFWTIFGLNAFLNVFPKPSPSAPGAAFMEALQATGYILPMMYASQVLMGVMLLSGRFVPLALVVLAPITLNIFLFDLFLNPSGLLIGGLISVLHVGLFYANRQVFLPFVKLPIRGNFLLCWPGMG